MKKVLVTGGSGFIGSHVVENLLAKGITPIIFDHRATNILPKGCELFLGDTRDFTAVSEAVAISSGVIHLAGVLGTQETINEPRPAVETNILGGLNIFQAIKNYKVPGVYIAVGNHFENNSYSISKTTTERFALMFNKEHGTKIAVVRGLNAYGPGQKQLPVKKIMPNFVIPSLQNDHIEIYGDGEQIMDMIYVKDLAEILVRALTMEHGVYDKVFEAGPGIHTSVNDIAGTVIREVYGNNAYPEPKHSPMRPGETPKVTVIANPKTLEPLDIHPQFFTTLDEGVKKTVEWYKAHPMNFQSKLK